LAYEIDALAGNSDLLEAKRFQTIAVTAEHLAMVLERYFELARHGCALHRHRLGVGQSHTRSLTLADDRIEALARHADLFVQPRRFLAELTHLHAHLLSALEEPLELALHLLDALAQVRQRMVAGLDELPLPRLPRRQRRRV